MVVEVNVGKDGNYELVVTVDVGYAVEGIDWFTTLYMIYYIEKISFIILLYHNNQY